MTIQSTIIQKNNNELQLNLNNHPFFPDIKNLMK